jgi:(E)-4-hydroxy-3-methyl-but-2-enyl pyrophosphate reductase
LSTLEGLEARGITTIDTTCPNVRKAQNAAKELSGAGFWVVVFGDPGHPEVKGIIGWAANKGLATLDIRILAEDRALPARLGLLSQTTRNRDQFVDFADKVVSSLLPGLEELRIINTLCDVTKRRQTAALELARSVDMMIVVGGRHSANTRCLAEVCSKAGARTQHVETASEIEEAWFRNNQVIGVTTGTSISDNVIEEVVLKLEQAKRRFSAN